jgi:large subunit ribosomal protein L16
MLFNGPKKLVKFKKTKKGRLLLFENKNNLNFGELGLKSLQSGILTSKQIEAARQVIVRKTKRKIKLWIKIFPNVSVTSKPIGTRMGKGKGSISHYICKIKRGTVIFEVCGPNLNILINALCSSQDKLPIKTKVFR